MHCPDASPRRRTLRSSLLCFERVNKMRIPLLEIVVAHLISSPHIVVCEANRIEGHLGRDVFVPVQALARSQLEG
jgi:hypothetical protein